MWRGAAPACSRGCHDGADVRHLRPRCRKRNSVDGSVGVRARAIGTQRASTTWLGRTVNRHKRGEWFVVKDTIRWPRTTVSRRNRTRANHTTRRRSGSVVLEAVANRDAACFIYFSSCRRAHGRFIAGLVAAAEREKGMEFGPSRAHNDGRKTIMPRGNKWSLTERRRSAKKGAATRKRNASAAGRSGS